MLRVYKLDYLKLRLFSTVKVQPTDRAKGFANYETDSKLLHGMFEVPKYLSNNNNKYIKVRKDLNTYFSKDKSKIVIYIYKDIQYH